LDCLPHPIVLVHRSQLLSLGLVVGVLGPELVALWSKALVSRLVSYCGGQLYIPRLDQCTTQAQRTNHGPRGEPQQSRTDGGASRQWNGRFRPKYSPEAGAGLLPGAP
jgi:hypothetical protein